MVAVPQSPLLAFLRLTVAQDASVWVSAHGSVTCWALLPCVLTTLVPKPEPPGFVRGSRWPGCFPNLFLLAQTGASLGLDVETIESPAAMAPAVESGPGVQLHFLVWKEHSSEPCHAQV